MARVLTTRRYTWDEIAPEHVYPSVERQVVDGGHQTLVRYVYRRGAVFPVHSHPQEQITTVLTGRIEFQVDGVSVLLGPGETAVIPAGIPHGTSVVGDETVVTLNALSPRRTTHP